MLPSFVVIGAMKAGTSSLYGYLDAHPEVFVSRPKEPEFFSGNWERGVAWYEQLFAPAHGYRAAGEFSTGYTKAPAVSGVPERMRAVIPDVRLVYLVRNPVERIRSMYVHQVSRSREHEPLAIAVWRDPEYLDLSRYAYQLEQYLEVFPRDQVLVVRSEDLRCRRAETVGRILDFIGVGSTLPDELSFERNRSSDRRRYGPVVDRFARGIRRFGITERVPSSIRRPVRRALARKVEKPMLSAELEDLLWAELAPDLERLRAIVGPEVDLWQRA